MTEHINHYRLTSSTVQYHITPEKREELKDALRAKLRQMELIYRIGFWDADTETFTRWDIETTDFSMDNDVCGDAMDQVWVEYSLEFDTLPHGFCRHAKVENMCWDCEEEWEQVGQYRLCPSCNTELRNCDCVPF